MEWRDPKGMQVQLLPQGWACTFVPQSRRLLMPGLAWSGRITDAAGTRGFAALLTS